MEFGRIRIMESINKIDPIVKPVGLWRELFTIFLLYLKIFLLTLLFGSVFFFLYAGIKTNHIPLDIVATALSALVSFIVGVITFHYVGKIKVGREKVPDFTGLVRQSVELEKLASEIKQLDFQLKQEMIKLQVEQKSQGGDIVNDVERRKVDLLVRFLEPTPVFLSVLVLEILKYGFSSGIISIISSDSKERQKII